MSTSEHRINNNNNNNDIKLNGSPPDSPELKIGRILVLGSTGKVGRPTVAALLAAGHDRIRLMVRDKARAIQVHGEHAEIEYVQGDFDKLNTIVAALTDVERVFLIGNGQPSLEIEVARAAKRAGVALLVKLSVVGASYNEPACCLLKSHMRSEDGIHSVGIPYVILRCGFYFQNWLGEVTIKHGFFSKPRGNYRIVHLDCRDIGEAACNVLLDEPQKHSGLTYYLTGNEAFSFAEAAGIISKAIGKLIILHEIDDAAWFKTLVEHKVPRSFAMGILKLIQAGRAGSFATIHGDLRILLGRDPRTFAEFIAEHKSFFA